MGTNTNNATVIARSNQRITALQKHLGAKDTVFIQGKTVNTAALVAVFQSAIDTRGEVVSTQGEYKAALAARETAETARAITDDALKEYVLQRFGANSAEAHDFGYSARKVGEKSPATKARAALLNQATRDARHTMGKKQRLGVKGTLPPTATTPPANGAQTEAAGAAAPVAPAGSSVVAAPAQASTPSPGH
jgi:hypothetical protein